VRGRALLPGGLAHAPEYDQARAAPEWLALVAGHRATKDRAKVVVTSAGMAPTSD
jgi:hypothetical protein